MKIKELLKKIENLDPEMSIYIRQPIEVDNRGNIEYFLSEVIGTIVQKYCNCAKKCDHEQDFLIKLKED